MIASRSNPKIRMIQQLNRKGKVRREEGLFVTEGIKLFLETPVSLRKAVFVSESFERENKDLLAGVSYEAVEESLFRRTCDTETPQGILTVTEMPLYAREDLLGGSDAAPLILVLENVQDPGNVGTMIRTAEGAGVSGVVLGGSTADLFAPKAVRATMGSVFRVPFVRERDLADFMRWMREKEIRSYAAHLHGRRDYNEENYIEGTAFLIGNEGNGLSAGLTEQADCLIRIPMEGKVESLNASIAAALLMYAAHAQRK